MEQTHDTPSHDDEELDNVIPIHGDEIEPDDDDSSSGADTEVLDVGITEEILTTDLIGGIRGYVDMSRKYLESSTSSITPMQLNDYMADNYEDSLTDEQRIAMAEFDVLLAKHGQTPARSVEGIVALRQMLVDAFKDNSLVPQQVQLELKELNQSIAVLEETYQSHLERSINESEAAAITSQQEREQADIDLKVTKAKGEVTVGTAEVEAKEQNVENKLRAGIADNNEGITRRYHKADTNQRHPAAQSFDWLSNDRVIAPNTRSSVFFVLSQQVLSAFDYKTVEAEPQRANKFVSSAASTMYLTIPYERRQQAAPLVSAFIEAVVAAWRQQRRAHAQEDDATLLLVLDEAADISPLPSLAGLLTSGAGDGIQVVFALQEPSQSKAWGDDAGAVLSGSRLLSILPGVRDEEYLANLAQLSHKEVAYDVNVIVSPEWVGGNRYATAERLIQERQYIERQLRGEPSRRHHFLRLKAAQPVARQRRRDGIRCIEDDTANVLSVLEEIMTYTDVSTLVDRRPTLEVSELTQASPNTIAFFAGSTYRKLDIVHWREDELWKRVLM